MYNTRRRSEEFVSHFFFLFFFPLSKLRGRLFPSPVHFFFVTPVCMRSPYGYSGPEHVRVSARTLGTVLSLCYCSTTICVCVCVCVCVCECADRVSQKLLDEGKSGILGRFAFLDGGGPHGRVVQRSPDSLFHFQRKLSTLSGPSRNPHHAV